MFGRTLTLLVMAALAGCAGKASDESSSNTSADGPSPTELAAYAGAARYPSEMKSKELRAHAVVDRENGIIKIYNLGNQNLRDVRVWVNKSFVKRIDGIAPQSSVTIRTDELYDGLGRTFASQDEEVAIVQLQTLDELYDLMGPTAK